MKHEHYIVSGKDIQKLNEAIREMEEDGYVTKGKHIVVIKESRHAREGKLTRNTLEYSQSMIKRIEE